MCQSWWSQCALLGSWRWLGGGLLFSNPASESSRLNMTVRRSRDGGSTWPEHVQIWPGGSAYSVLVPVGGSGEAAGIVFETMQGSNYLHWHCVCSGTASVEGSEKGESSKMKFKVLFLCALVSEAQLVKSFMGLLPDFSSVPAESCSQMRDCTCSNNG